MTAKTKAGGKILGAVHETAHDLHSAGFIDMRSMRNYDALCLEAVPKILKRKDPCAARPAQTQPGSLRVCTQHQPVDWPSMGNR